MSPDIQSNNRISIQVSLSGYSFKVLAPDGAVVSASADWLGPGTVFTTPELQRRYAGAEIALMTPKFALVPSAFLLPGEEREALADVCDLAPGDEVRVCDVPQFGARLVYSLTVGETLSKVIAQSLSAAEVLPEIWYLLRALADVPEYNRIVASHADGRLYLAIAQGKTLLLANSYPAPDFTTAEYYLFLAVKRLQINPEASAVWFRTPLGPAEEMSLYRYFKAVGTL